MRTTHEVTGSRRRPGRIARAVHSAVLATSVVSTMSLLLACSKGDQSAAAGDTSATQGAPASSTANASGDAGTRAGRSTVRGSVASVSDTALTVTTRTGDVHITLAAPVTIYTRAPATLADVQPNTFVGVTSVLDPDGSQHATEIHIFPEALRGTGEGSYPMQQPSSSSASHGSTMTNGSVAASGGAARMTNGAAQVQPGGTITVQYAGGQQTIKVPAGVSVTKITPANEKLASGANVIVVAMKQPNGELQSSTIFLARDSTTRH